jgi:hypothetical protein
MRELFVVLAILAYFPIKQSIMPCVLFSVYLKFGFLQNDFFGWKKIPVLAE